MVGLKNPYLIGCNWAWRVSRDRGEDSFLFPIVVCQELIPPVCLRSLPAIFLIFYKSPFGSYLIFSEFPKRYMHSFLFQVFSGMEIFGIRRISLGRGSQTKDHTALVLHLHIELEPRFWCAGILPVPGSWVFLLSLAGCYVWMQPRLEVAGAKMRKRNDAHTSLNSSKEHQPPTAFLLFCKVWVT